MKREIFSFRVVQVKLPSVVCAVSIKFEDLHSVYTGKMIETGKQRKNVAENSQTLLKFKPTPLPSAAQLCGQPLSPASPKLARLFFLRLFQSPCVRILHHSGD